MKFSLLFKPLLLLFILGIVGAISTTFSRPESPQLWAQENPTATPTRTPLSTTGFLYPLSRDVVFGSAIISGTAMIDSYRRYDLHISVAGYEEWQWLTTSYGFAREAELYTWDTTGYRDGFYDLRLRAQRDSGNYNEAFVRGVEIRNGNPPTPTPVLNATDTPVSPLVTPTATWTPTPDTSSRIPGWQGFYEPENGATLRGFTPIIATVNGLNDLVFERYELFISSAGLEEWSWLISSQQQFWQDTIYVLNTNQIADGFYDLRLRIVYRDSNYSEYHLRNLRVANNNSSISNVQVLGIHIPRSGTKVAGIVDFIGTAVNANFLRWELYWSPGGQDNWSFLVKGDTPVANRLLARLDLRQLMPGSYDFRLRLVRKDYNYDEYYARDIIVAQ